MLARAKRARAAVTKLPARRRRRYHLSKRRRSRRTMVVQRTKKSATRDSMRSKELMDWVRCSRYGGMAMASRRHSQG